MTLHVFTARISTRDPDRLDITRKSASEEGLAFAPSWALLRPHLALRSKLEGLTEGARNAEKLGELATARDLRRQAAETEIEIARAWASYVPGYLAEMRVSYRSHRAGWEALLARERVVLVCFCTEAERCHRTLLAREILPRLGAEFHGEI